MAYPDKINALVDVTADQTLAEGGHAARHNDVNDALDELEAVFTAPAANELALRPDGTNQRFHIDSAGDVTITGDISFDGGTDLTTALAGKAPLASPTFTGTVEAADIEVSGGVFLGGSAAANELDDYEEGTFTVSVSFATSGSATLDRDLLSYRKIGSVVHVFGQLQFDTVSSPVGRMSINIPFALRSQAGANREYSSWTVLGAQTFTTNPPASAVLIGSPGTTATMGIFFMQPDGTVDEVNGTYINGNERIYFDVSYVTT